MIRNERELQAALQWIEYWKTNRSGQASWLGREQAARHIIELRKGIDDYRRTAAAVPPPDSSPQPVETPT